MNSDRRRLLRNAGVAALAVPLSACGTLLYPERKGQRGGRIDPAVAILNGIGLILFLVPGLVAFAVDFHYGTIYLPGTQNADAGGDETIAVLDLEAALGNGALTDEAMDALWLQRFGEARPFRNAELRRQPLPEGSDPADFMLSAS
jgi:hypothetical protein